jgi:hypothetical protein
MDYATTVPPLFEQSKRSFSTDLLDEDVTGADAVERRCGLPKALQHATGTNPCPDGTLSERLNPLMARIGYMSLGRPVRELSFDVVSRFSEEEHCTDFIEDLVDLVDDPVVQDGLCADVH